MTEMGFFNVRTGTKPAVGKGGDDFNYLTVYSDRRLIPK